MRTHSELRLLLESLLEDDAFPRAGATLAANPVLLTLGADKAMAALSAEAEQRGEADRAVAVSQLRAFVGRCRRIGLAAVFVRDDPNIDPAVVTIVGADMRSADDAEGSYDHTGNIDALTAAAAAWRRVMTHPSLTSAYPATLFRHARLNGGIALILHRGDDLRSGRPRQALWTTGR